ncbi:hypothetical protein DFQ14_1075 [Halopolyspora algeriensis]|uniref:Uncharacterized protein n=1 Tax=Halopolyspora algeriensis TaxID=1500506 RepID=A0A368VNL7_9ACTN|nr:hypothetical protein [Halopolyspora algeriensis]RCW43118.1 hypothetical protein DFQ14_1075 [Halopolyspora algeriensis]TQM56176.1 hypothetical protein FHU43_0968 [Halopolyspora algeriensis]
MQVGVFIHWTFTVRPEHSGLDLFEHGDQLTEALLNQEACTSELKDSAVSVDRRNSVIEIEASVVASSANEAIAIGQAAIRAAIHASGGGTPTWPSHDELVTLLPTNLQTEELALT